MADWIEQLERLSRLHQAGALSDEEFAAQKAKLLAAADQPAVAEAPVPTPTPPPSPDPVTVAAPAAEPGWDAEYDEPARSSAGKWALIGIPAALLLAGAAWFGATLVGGKTDPQLASGPTQSATPTPSETPLATASPTQDAPLPAALDGTLAFAEAANCKAGTTLEAIYKKLDSAGNLGSGRGITVKLDAFDDPLAVEAKKNTDADGVETQRASLRFPANTTWHGLKLSRLTSETTIVPESDGGYERTITFLEEPDKVRTTLARLGFGAPRAPDYAELSDEGCGGSMQVQAIGGGTALSCQWGC